MTYTSNNKTTIILNYYYNKSTSIKIKPIIKPAIIKPIINPPPVLK
jgi:hypothetical protein